MPACCRAASLALAALLLLSGEARAQTQGSDPSAAASWLEARRVDRLEASMVELAHADGLVRRVGGVGALVLGGTAIVGGVLIALSGDADWGGRGRAAVSGFAWSAGASLIAVGIYRWFSTTPAEERLTRWTELRQRQALDRSEFGRFEGELASEALLARFNRRLAAFGSFGLVAAGGGVLGLAASSELEGSAERGGYVLGSVLIGVGAIQSAALLLFATPAERAWRHYAHDSVGLFSQLQPPRLLAAELRPRFNDF